MILYTRVENYRSIGKQQVLSILPGSDKTHIDRLIEEGSEKILSVIPIYGGNATGKTNTLRFIKNLRDIVVGDKSLEELYEPCKFFKGTPTKLEIIFIKNEIKYYYAVKYDGEMIFEEKLYYYPNKRIAKIFDKTESGYSFGSEFESTLKKYSEDTSKDMSFLKFIAKWLKGKEKNIDDANNFFKEDLVFVGLEKNANSLQESIKIFKSLENRESVQKFIDFFYRHMNIGAKGIRFLTLTNDSREDIVKKILDNGNLLEQFKKENKIELEEEVLKNYLIDSIGNKLEMVYEIEGKEVYIDINEESKGIQKIFELGRYFADVLCNNKVLIFDELELSFHPILARKIVELFMNKNAKSQLIFTTHDTNLLDLDLFRRDQIYFTSRTNKTGFQTVIKSLSEIAGIRKTTDIEKGYLNGEYCDIPLEKDFSEDELFGGMSCQKK